MTRRGETASIISRAPSETYTDITAEEGPVFNVDEAMGNIGMGPYQYRRFPIVAMVGFSQSCVLMLPYLLLIYFTCNYHLSTLEQGITIGAMLTGNLLGDLVAGMVCDRTGRKFVLVLGTWVLTLGTLSLLLLTHFFFFLLWRTFSLGIGIGLCTFTSIIYVSEMATPGARGKSITLINVFWGAGTLYTATMAWLFMNNMGVKAVVVMVTIPLFVTSILCCLLPDTPKYLAASGDPEGARAVLKAMAEENDKELPVGSLHTQPVLRRGEMRDMFETDHIRNSVMMMIIFFAAGFVFYTGYAMTPYILEEGYCGLPKPKAHKVCTFASDTLKEAVIITAAEVTILPFTAALSENWGRLPTIRLIACFLLLASIFIFWCLSPLVFLIALFLQRGACQSLFNVLYLYTPELYPTYMRAVSCGVVMSCMTGGGLVSSLLVYTVGEGYSWKILMGLIAACALVVCVTTFLLELETQGTYLPDMSVEVGACMPCKFVKKKIRKKIKRYKSRRQQQTLSDEDDSEENEVVGDDLVDEEVGRREDGEVERVAHDNEAYEGDG